MTQSPRSTSAEKAGKRRAPRNIEPRRTPQQQRSRKRVSIIVETARKLIGERGNDAVSVREIAEAAEVPIASVYQYFPDKTAILRTLMDGYLETMRSRLLGIFGRIEKPEDLEPATLDAFAAFYRLVVDNPALSTIWSGVQANTALRELDAEDTRINAEFVASVLRRVLPDVDPEEIADTTLFAVHTIGTTVRQALSSDPISAQRLIREMNHLARLRLAELVEQQRKLRRRPSQIRVESA